MTWFIKKFRVVSQLKHSNKRRRVKMTSMKKNALKVTITFNDKVFEF